MGSSRTIKKSIKDNYNSIATHIPSFCFIFLLLLFNQNSYSNEIGKIEQIKGTLIEVSSGKSLDKDSPIFEKAILKTSDKSFAKIRFNDQSVLIIGPNSETELTQYSTKLGERSNTINFLKGQFRSIIKKHLGAKETFQFRSGLVSLGVRGTEFLVNSYMVTSSPNTDVLLLKGSVEAKSIGSNPLLLKRGEFFNSQEYSLKGQQAIRTLSENLIENISANQELFMPNIHLNSGEFLDLNKVFTKPSTVNAINTPGLPLGGISSHKISKKIVKTINEVDSKKLAKLKNENKAEFVYDLTKEPWAIRDAILKNQEDKTKCYFFFYKQIPGAGDKELFRRDRDCDEYEYDL